MKLKTISVGYAITIPQPTGIPYSNIRPSIEIQAEVGEGENINMVHKNLCACARTLMMQQAQDACVDLDGISRGPVKYIKSFMENLADPALNVVK